MATTAGDIYVRSGASGSFTEITYVQGGWITVASSSTMYSLYHDRLKGGQIVYVQSQNQLYVTSKFVAFETPGYAGFDDSASFATFQFPPSSGTISGSAQIGAFGYLTSASAVAAGFGSGGGSVPSGTISGSTQITALGFVNSTQTSSMSVLSALTASFISDVFISASAVRSGFGTTLFPSGLLSSSFQIATDISGAFTSLSSSFQSRINSLEVGGGSSIFKLTGSFYSTTNNIQITGSLSVGSGSFKSFEVNSDGFVVLGDMNKDLNNAPIGTIAYSASSFYLIS